MDLTKGVSHDRKNIQVGQYLAHGTRYIFPRRA